jgi:hypothetical protein
VPLAVATIRDRAGSYEAGFLLIVALALLGSVAVALLPARCLADRSWSGVSGK